MTTKSNLVKLATVTLNQTVGDWAGNIERIQEALSATLDSSLVLFPEMCISGYSLGDRLLMQGTLRRSWNSLEKLAKTIHNQIVVVGLPIQHRDTLYNVAAVLAGGRICGLVPKENLATGDVEYESRWYASWLSSQIETFVSPSGQEIPIGGLIFEATGVGKFAIEVCEDGWKGIRPGSRYALSGAKIILNPSASWFTIGKHRIRRRMVEQISREDICAYAYTSLQGCDSTRLIYDGSSFIASRGSILAEGDRFVFGKDYAVTTAMIDVQGLQRARLGKGSWRQQSEQLNQGVYGDIPPTIVINGDYRTTNSPTKQQPYWKVNPKPLLDPSLQHLVKQGLLKPIQHLEYAHVELELALCMAIREYLKKCGIKRVALALSGGRDSTMCAVLVRRMVDYSYPTHSSEERAEILHNLLVTAYMGTENSGIQTRLAASALATELGALHYDGDIQGAFDTHIETFKRMTGIELSWDDAQHDIPLQNVQARLRGSLIWMVANVHNALLITTSNKSEVAVGYTTMDGDTSGGLAPIADVPKSLIIEWLEWASRYHSYDSIAKVVQVPSTAELRPPGEEQTDEDDLMPFVILDQLMYYVVHLGLEPLETFHRLWSSVETFYDGERRQFGEHIDLFFKKLCFSQWKRERFAISFRVANFDLDPKSGFRFPPVQAPFREELADMWEWIAQQEGLQP